MNILIMDDDEYIVESIKSMTDWAAIGIDGVFSAVTVTGARQIFEMVSLQIMLCDIEMHDESGLDFVEWARAEGSTAQVLFLTSYADFSYAHKALHLQTQEYLLKPVRYDELTRSLERAVSLARMDQINRDGLKRWENSYNFRRDGFWKEVVFQEAGKSRADVENRMRQLGLDYQETDRFVCLFIEIYDFQTILEDVERGMYDIALREISEEFLGQMGFSAESVFRTDREDAARWNIILCQEHRLEDAECRVWLEKIGQKYIQKIRRKWNSMVGCYMGKPAACWEIPMQSAQMAEMVLQDVLGAGKVQFLEDYRKQIFPYIKPEFEKWEGYLESGETERLLCSVDQYMKHMEYSEQINAENLRIFYAEFVQMILSALKNQQIPADFLQGRMNPETVKSIWTMQQYTERMIRDTAARMEVAAREQSVVERVKKYIQEHYSEELTRESLAQQVHLNPDYFSRLFRTETGESLGGYLSRYRVERAKELIKGTDGSISEVACQVGYTNFSYFTKIFRKYAQCTPNEYRRNIRRHMSE